MGLIYFADGYTLLSLTKEFFSIVNRWLKNISGNKGG